MTSLPEDRGQTLHDFAIGMIIFLLILGYVFSFVPGLFAPFSPETDGTAIRVDRTADYLTEDLLVTGKTDRVLNATCTRYFFNGSPPANCDQLSESITEQRILELAALPDDMNINVSMVRTDGPAEDPGSPITLAVGSDPETTSDRVIRAVRIVSFDGRDYRFFVRVW